MNKNKCTAMYQAKSAETAEEIIGVLTAISVVSKRMAKKLALLEERSARKDGGKCDGRSKRFSPNAN